MNSDWIDFVRTRLNELHPFVFSPDHCGRFAPKTIAANRLAWKFYHEHLHTIGFGRDYSQLPQLKLPII